MEVEKFEHMEKETRNESPGVFKLGKQKLGSSLLLHLVDSGHFAERTKLFSYLS